MVKNIYIVRHCEATGQPAASPLTKNGFAQANDLADFLQKMNIERIWMNGSKK